MLVLTRNTNEGIVIELADGTDILIKVLEVRPRGGGYNARIGIEAPGDVLIRREELPTFRAGDLT